MFFIPFEGFPLASLGISVWSFDRISVKHYYYYYYYLTLPSVAVMTVEAKG